MGRGTWRLTSDEVDRLVQAYIEGESLREVGLRFGVSKQAVSYHLARRRVRTRTEGLRGKRGPEHPKWRGGRAVHPEGYIQTNIAHTGHPWPRRSDMLGEHIRVMELHLGRRLAADEVVHHRDGDPANNSLDNLELMTRAEHTRLHHAQRRAAIHFHASS